MKGKEYPLVLKTLISESGELLDLAKRTQTQNLRGKRLDIILTNRIAAVGSAVNAIIEDSSLDHSLCYEAINDATYKIKETINLLPLNSLDSKSNILSIYSLSMFLINNLIYFSDNDIEKLNTISLVLSELLITNSLLLEEKGFFDEFKTTKKKKFTAYQRFCQSICSLIQNALSSVPAVSEKDFLLWSGIVACFSTEYLSVIKNFSYEKIAEKNTLTNRYTKKTELVCLSVYIHVSTMLIIASALQFIVGSYYNKLTTQSQLADLFGDNVNTEYSKIVIYIEKSINDWLTGIEEDYKNGVIPIVDDPVENMNFVISKLGHKYILFIKIFNERIFKYFSEQEQDIDPRISESYLTEIIQSGEDFLGSAEKIFKSKENVIKSPYGPTYLGVFQRVAATSYLLAMERKTSEPIDYILKEYDSIFSSIPVSRMPSLFITKIIMQITKNIEEENLTQLETCLELINNVRKDLEFSSFYECLTLAMLNYLLQVALEKIDSLSLAEELKILKEQQISSYLPHLEEKYDNMTNVLLMLNNNNNKENGEKLIFEHEIIPLDHNSWFFPPFDKLDRIRGDSENINFKAFNFLAMRNKIVENLEE